MILHCSWRGMPLAAVTGCLLALASCSRVPVGGTDSREPSLRFAAMQTEDASAPLETVGLPGTQAESFATAGFGWISTYIGPDSPASSGAPADLSESGRDQTDAICTLLLREELVPDRAAWSGWRVPGTDVRGAATQIPLAVAPLTVRVWSHEAGLRDGLFSGRVSRAQGGLHVWGRVGGEWDPEWLAGAFASSAVRWPPGLDGMGAVTTPRWCGGAVWRHMPRLPGNARTNDLGVFPTSWPPDEEAAIARGWLRITWPMAVTCWSDGSWVLLSVFGAAGQLQCHADRTGTMRNRPPEDFLAPDAEPVMLKWLERLDKEWHAPCIAEPIHALDPTVVSVTRRRQLVAGDPDQLRDVAEHPTETLELAGVAEPHTRRVRNQSCEFLTSQEWAKGADAPIPEKALEYLNLPAGTTCWQVSLEAHAILGTATVGLLAFPPGVQADGAVLHAVTAQGTPLDLGPDLPRREIAQWVLSERFFALTVLRPTAPQTRWSVETYGVQEELTKRLAAYLGEYGWRLVLCPTSRKKLGEGMLFRTVEGEPFGLDGKGRIGDQPWGRARVFVDQALLHVVFER